MEKIPTAEEFLENHLEISYFYDDKSGAMVCYADDMQKAMIEFARLHVQAALEAASVKAELKEAYSGMVWIDEESILNAYPLENIK